MRTVVLILCLLFAGVTYGEERFNEPASDNAHIGFLRPLITREVIDDLLTSETFGRHIDAENIGVSGFSFGGFTALAVTGGVITSAGIVLAATFSALALLPLLFLFQIAFIVAAGVLIEYTITSN